MWHIEFTKDYATMKKGEIGKYDSMLAARLIGKKVAKKVEPTKRVRKAKKESE